MEHRYRKIARPFLALVGVLGLLAASSEAATTDSGSLTGANTWTSAGSPYLVAADLIVEDGASLSIGPGVSVRFAPGTRLSTYGSFAAIGTADARILFLPYNEVDPWSGIAVIDAASCYIAHALITGADSQDRYATTPYGDLVSGAPLTFWGAGDHTYLLESVEISGNNTSSGMEIGCNSLLVLGDVDSREANITVSMTDCAIIANNGGRYAVLVEYSSHLIATNTLECTPVTGRNADFGDRLASGHRLGGQSWAGGHSPRHSRCR